MVQSYLSLSRFWAGSQCQTGNSHTRHRTERILKLIETRRTFPEIRSNIINEFEAPTFECVPTTRSLQPPPLPSSHGKRHELVRKSGMMKRSSTPTPADQTTTVADLAGYSRKQFLSGTCPSMPEGPNITLYPLSASQLKRLSGELIA